MTDHRVLIVKHLDIAEHAHNDDMARTHVAIAQVYATAAQTEQLRVGNLIAYVGLIETQFRDAKDDVQAWDWTTYDASFARRETAQVLIREGLDL